MLSIQFIINLFKDTKAVQIIYFFLAVSIIQVIDLFLTIYLTHIFGEYLIMAIICAISLFGLLITINRMKVKIQIIKDKCNNGDFPEISFFEVTGIFTAAILIFIPGFLSAIIGFSLLIPIMASNSGRYISTKTDTDWHTVYEYMKI